MYEKVDAATRADPLPHLNSGSFMGKAGSLLLMLNEVMDDLSQHHTNIPGVGSLADVDDQVCIFTLALTLALALAFTITTHHPP